MIIILGVVASDSSSDHACDYAAVELTTPMAKKIVARMDAVMALYRQDRSTHEICFLDSAVTFFQRRFADGLDGFIPRDASEYLLPAEPTAALDGSPVWTESESMVVAVNATEPEVYWRARAKHAPIHMQTCSVPKSEIARAANGDTILAGGQWQP